MKRAKITLLASTVILICVLGYMMGTNISKGFGIQSDTAAQALDGDGNGWAVLLEMNIFPEGWSDLPVGYINSERMRTALVSSGWNNDQILALRDNITISTIKQVVKWLANNTKSNEVVLLYIFTHGMWMRSVLNWNDWFPSEWAALNASRRILIVDSCMAEEFIEPIKLDPASHVSLAGCSADEVAWAGLEEEGLPIIGSVWNYYFTNALCNLSADHDENGVISIEEAFNFSTPLVQQYMNKTVFAVPEFLQQYHDIGIYPEDHDAYPNPVIDDAYLGQLIIPEFPKSLALTFLIAVTITAALATACTRPKTICSRHTHTRQT